MSPEDIVERLYYRSRQWYWSETPIIKVTGKPGSFGELTFTFAKQIIVFKIYISSEADAKDIETVAQYAVLNREKFYMELSEAGILPVDLSMGGWAV